MPALAALLFSNLNFAFYMHFVLRQFGVFDQVSDFGLAKLALDSYTHVTTRVMGTFGYVTYVLICV